MAILELSDTIKDVPAKDSKITRRNAAINGLLDPKPYSDELNRAWNFRTVGWGSRAGVLDGVRA